MKILVIGNGSTGVDLETKKAYINNHTGYFLNKINEKVNVGFMQFTSVYSKNLNLQNYDITSSSILNHNLPNKKHPLFLVKLIRIFLQYDFIYIFYPGSLGTLVGLFAKVLKIPYGLYVRGEYFNRNIFDKIVLKRSKFILTISPSFVPKLQQFCNNVAVIKPMISILKSDLKRNRIYGDNTTIKFLFVGRVEQEKGIYELINIALQFKNNNINFTIDVVGGGDLFEVISSKIVDKGLSKYVFLHGQIANKAELKAFYNNANIFVFPSHHEGFPRVIYEAMASGLPIFTTFVGGIPGRMIHLKNCIEIPVKDGEVSAKTISKYFKDNNTLEYIGRNGQKTIEHIIDGSLLDHDELLLKELFNEK